MSQDLGFPIIKYAVDESPRQWGLEHGERFKDAIQDLSRIRKELLQARALHLTGERLRDEANAQWLATKNFDESLFEELEGIQIGSGLSVEDIVILNNYTDFRDIPADEGCSTVYAGTVDGAVYGQTWDMHRSAKDYLAILEIPAPVPQYVFTLVGCIGMMGFSATRKMIGVNNLNSTDARSGILWPALVRKVLLQQNHSDMEAILETAAVTSAHAYLIASEKKGELWEILPTLRLKLGEVNSGAKKSLFHTNHCLDKRTKKFEVSSTLSSTTFLRFEKLSEKIKNVHDLESLKQLLTDHDGYPKSICSHFESGAQDPAFTCGGAIGSQKSGELIFWRGCEKYDENFKTYRFTFSEDL